MKRPENPTKVIEGVGLLGGDGECGFLLVEEETVEIVDGSRKEKFRYGQHYVPSLGFDDLFPTPYKSGQNLGRDKFRFRIEVEVEVLR